MPVTTVTPFPLGGPIPAFYADLIDPFVGLARASAVTKTLKLGTGICLVPERNPLLLAKEVATLDHFSGGRFLFGIGAGWLKEETEIMGGDFAAPLDADPGGHPGDAGPLDAGGGRVPREVL
jgi:alkanesulfonate monooxygenase SsuD/methylene tetrahydromethanopterin reductase-like flavin-dependent oxidoreductase (luciferase family)